MNVVLLSQFFAPEPVPKVHLLAGGLVLRGHAATVITGFPNYPFGRIYPGYRQRPWRREERDGVRVWRLPLYPDHSRSIVRRSLSYLSFAASASLLGPVCCGASDLLWAYDPSLTTGFPAWVISRIRHMPFVLDIPDMWPDTLAAVRVVTSQRILRWIGRVAKASYGQATAITVTSPGFKRLLVGRGILPDTIHVIPDWIDEKVYRPVLPNPELVERHGMAGRFNVVFAGNVGPAQALEVVIDAATLLRGVENVQFLVIGDGLDRAALARQARARALTNVRFVEQQPPELMPWFYASAGALLVHLKRDPLFAITMPSKVMAYMACGRPILCAVEGDAADIVRGAGAGLTCPSEDPAALAASIRTLHSMPRAALEGFGEAARRAFLTRYAPRLLLDEQVSIFNDVVARWNRGRKSKATGSR